MTILDLQGRTSLRPLANYGTMPSMARPVLSPADYQKVCGDRLRKLIIALDLTFVQAAEIIGITKHVLNHWMKGHHPIQANGLYRLAMVKNVDFNFVFLGDWSRLPHDLAQEFEAELRATLAGASEPADRASESA